VKCLESYPIVSDIQTYTEWRTKNRPAVS